MAASAFKLDPTQSSTVVKIVQSLVNEEGQITVGGRDIIYKAKGRVHSLKEPWVYDGTAWDIQSGISVKAKHYKSSQGAIEHAMLKLLERLKKDEILVVEGRNESHDMRGIYQNQPDDQGPGESGNENVNDSEKNQEAGGILDKRTSQKDVLFSLANCDWNDILRAVNTCVNDKGQPFVFDAKLHPCADDSNITNSNTIPCQYVSSTSAEASHFKESEETQKKVFEEVILELRKKGIIKDEVSGESKQQNQDSPPPPPDIPVAEGRNKSHDMQDIYQNQPDDQEPGESGIEIVDDSEEKQEAAGIPDKRTSQKESEKQNQDSSPLPPEIPVAEGRNNSHGMQDIYQNQPNDQEPGVSGNEIVDDSEEKQGAAGIPDKRTSQKELDISWYYQVFQDYEFVFRVAAAVLIVPVAVIRVYMYIETLYRERPLAMGFITISLIGTMMIHVLLLNTYVGGPSDFLLGHMYTIMIGFAMVGIVGLFKPSQPRVRMSSKPPITAATNLEDLPEVEPDDGGLYTSRHVIAARPTAEQLRVTEHYTTWSPIKGLAYILNNREFTQQDAEPNRRRNGSQVDFTNMKHLFDELGYIIVPHENLDSKDIRETIKSFVAKFNDADYNSSVVVLMSHGDTGVILGTDQRPVWLKEIQEEFEGRNCPKLQGKPKLFFIQACRGYKVTTTCMTECDTIQSTTLPFGGKKHVEDLATDDNFAMNVPDNADMHFAYATTEGYLSLRSKVEGSWFIQVIMEVFLANAHNESLDKLMNKVTNRVSSLKGKLFDPETKKSVKAKQIPERVSRMRKTFYFLPKYPPTF